MQDRPVQSHPGCRDGIAVDGMLVAGEPVKRCGFRSDVHRTGHFGTSGAGCGGDAGKEDRVDSLKLALATATSTIVSLPVGKDW